MGKNPWIAAGLSLLFGGLGQFYVGDWLKGLAFLVMDFATGYVYLHVNAELGAAANIVVGVVAITDAYNGAKRKNAGAPAPKAAEHVHPPLRVF
ncbi:MAG: hypothetical protein V1875_06175 [Candidatus Altiarchaeota archaeon]